MLDNGNVYLRALEPTDIDVIHRWENDCDLWRFGCATAPFSRHQIWEYLKNYTADIFAQKQLRMMVCLKTADNAVGMIDLFDFDPVNRRAAVGLLIDREYQRQGIGGDAMALLLEYARDVLHLHQVYAVVAADNAPSLWMFERQVSAMRALCTTGFCVPTADMSTLCRCSLLLTDSLFLRVWKKSCHDAEQRRERAYKEYILHTCAVGKPTEESRTHTAESEHQSEKHP